MISSLWYKIILYTYTIVKSTKTDRSVWTTIASMFEFDVTVSPFKIRFSHVASCKLTWPLPSLNFNSTFFPTGALKRYRHKSGFEYKISDWFKSGRIILLAVSIVVSVWLQMCLQVGGSSLPSGQSIIPLHSWLLEIHFFMPGHWKAILLSQVQAGFFKN